METKIRNKDIINIIVKISRFKMYSLRLLFLLFGILLCNTGICQKNQEIPSNRATDSTVKKLGFVKELPANIQSSYWYKLYIQEREWLKLNSIDNGYNGLQIRIWIRHGYGDGPKNTSQLLIFDRSSLGDKGRILTYLAKYNSDWDSITSIKSEIKNLNPKSGWISFWRKLEKLRIYYLPDYSKLFDYNIAADSDGVIVEIADNTKYRMYYYPDYPDNKNRIKEAGEFYSIMKMLENEFSMKMIY